MLHLVLCFSIWSLISACLFWRLVTIAKGAIAHLQSLHRIPCSKCTYFTGDYRLKCTVNPMVAMTETAIGCRDFVNKKSDRHNNQPITCGGCFATNKCSNRAAKSKLSVFKLKLPNLNNEEISLNSSHLD